MPIKSNLEASEADKAAVIEAQKDMIAYLKHVESSGNRAMAYEKFIIYRHEQRKNQNELNAAKFKPQVK